MRPLIILDRDGVINHDSDHYIRCADEWAPIAGALSAIANLNSAGYTVVVATNQAGVAKGVFTLEILNQIHAKMERELASVGGHFDAIYYCPHHPEERCVCRKPAPGMLLNACTAFGVEPANAFFVGDSLRDIQAAKSAGCRPVLVLTGNGKKTLEHQDFPPDTLVYSNLLEFSGALIDGVRPQEVMRNEK